MHQRVRCPHCHHWTDALLVWAAGDSCPKCNTPMSIDQPSSDARPAAQTRPWDSPEPRPASQTRPWDSPERPWRSPGAGPAGTLSGQL